MATNQRKHKQTIINKNRQFFLERFTSRSKQNRSCQIHTEDICRIWAFVASKAGIPEMKRSLTQHELNLKLPILILTVL